MKINNLEGHLATSTHFVVCPNPDCKRTTITLWWGSGTREMQDGSYYVRWHDLSSIKTIRLQPPSYARPLSATVPVPVIEDYREACAILDLSPKAAATLARRALQGMIRHFHNIVRPTLNQEVLALKAIVDADLWEAIDAVRGVGNIGAHMEKDINLIVDVDPGEALQLVRMIELLSDEWYATREKRQRQLADLKALGGQKKELKESLKLNAGEPTEPES